MGKLNDESPIEFEQWIMQIEALMNENGKTENEIDVELNIQLIEEYENDFGLIENKI